MKISFHGAAGGVTGSCHLVTMAGRRILVDCGLFQGSRELDEDNAEPFGFDPAKIDVLLLTHAHLDHCGRIPLLVQRGFRGQIICTPATRDLTRRHANAAHRHTPLYDTLDVLDCLDHFRATAICGKPIHLGDGATATFFDAGHILGSTSILLDLVEAGRGRRILFSGDIGTWDRPLLDPPQPPSDVDVVVMESTYGDRDHRSRDATVAEFYAAIRMADERGGNVVIPTFALERAQELLFFLRDGMAKGELPGGLHVFLDSPMAISATQIFRRNADAMKTEVAAMLKAGKDPFDMPGLRFTRETSESMDLNRIRSGAIIMAGSGMCTGGRVRHHLFHNLGHRDCSVVFVGFAAEGTLARIIIDGAKSVKLLGRDIPVRAHVHTINGFSAHAGRRELLDWHGRTGTPEITFLVHGEGAARKSLAKKLRNGRIEMPELHESHEI